MSFKREQQCSEEGWMPRAPLLSLFRKVVPVVLSHVVPVPLSVSSIELPLSSLSNLSSFSLSSPPLSLSHAASLLPNFSYWISSPSLHSTLPNHFTCPVCSALLETLFLFFYLVYCPTCNVKGMP